MLAVFLAFLVGSVMIAATDDGVRDAASYIFARPATSSGAIWEAISGAYTAMFRGAVYNNRVDRASQTAIRPLTETLKFAAPLIAGRPRRRRSRSAPALFNIGGRGQMLLAGAAAGWVGFALDLPLVDPPAAGDPRRHGRRRPLGRHRGLLKARTGAHEVIVTIMLNYVAYYLVLLRPLASSSCSRRPARPTRSRRR